MNRIGNVVALGVMCAFAIGGTAQAATLVGVITSYSSGNQGTDMVVRGTDGTSHRLWFDNMRKPLFQGKPLPWCPAFPCAGWPRQLVLNKTLVRVYVFTHRVEGAVVETPTRIQLLR